jgi:NAD(P)-dependent dehydrogenase (short-subunit alcohol dehydrogenase family)
MKVVIVGATGAIGSAVVNELRSRHDVIPVGKSRGDFQVDITQPASISGLFAKIGKFDALVSTVGHVHFAPLAEMTPSLFAVGINDKLMGQVNLTQLSTEYLNPGGSVTLTSGILSREPIRAGSSASMVNGALEAFTLAAAIELPRGIRINCVSPTVLTESMESFCPYFRGFEPAPAARVALAYSKSVEGHHTGQIYRVG